MIRVLIVDDDRLVCRSIQTILEADNSLTVCAFGQSADEAVKLFHRHRPDILLMDIRMGCSTGIVAAKQVLEAFKDARVLFLTTFSDDDYIIEALRIGAKGYILKQNFESIVPALKAVFSGQRVFGDAIVNKLPLLIDRKKKPDFSQSSLTERETDIVSLVAEGLSNREIAERLFLSEGTVRNYISTVLEKLELRDRTQLAVFYYKNC
ncbi:MAG: response regulator transcription factor [Sporolactobacillus sp.]